MKVLLIGSRPQFHGRMRKFLNRLGGGLVFSEAPDFGEAISLSDCGDMVGLLCIDLDSVRHRGLHDLIRLQAAYPGVPVAMFDDGVTIAGSNATIACHRLDDDAGSDEARNVLAGIGDMMGIRLEGPAQADECRDPRLMRLTDREREVLHHLMSGMSNKAIARLLDLQEVTVKAHLRQVFRKLGVTNRTQATALAMNIYGGQAAGGERTAAHRPARYDRMERPRMTDGALAHAA